MAGVNPGLKEMARDRHVPLHSPYMLGIPQNTLLRCKEKERGLRALALSETLPY